MLLTDVNKTVSFATHDNRSTADPTCIAMARGAELRATAYPQGPTRKLKADENDILNGTYYYPLLNYT